MTDGKAYAFFDCNAPKESIEGELPKVRKCVDTPSLLELTLRNGFVRDPVLGPMAEKAGCLDRMYAMAAALPSASNEQTFLELGGILNQVYQSDLFGKGERMRGVMVYPKDGEYVIERSQL